LNKHDKKCSNCEHVGHTKENCWNKGRGKEGQGPHQKKKTESVNAAMPSPDVDYAFLTSTLTEVASALAIPQEQRGVIVDSGASSHFCPDREKFSTFTPIHPKPIRIADGRTLHATGRGNVMIQLPNGQECSKVTLIEALYVPDLAFTLISTSRIVNAGMSVIMVKGWCEIWLPKPKKLIAKIPEIDGLYRITGTEHAMAVTPGKPKTKMPLSHLHQCMGHMSFAATKSMIAKGMVKGLEITSSPDNEFCETCVKAKITRSPFPNELKTRATKYGERIHTDVWGPAKVQSLGKKRYYVLFTDDYSHKTKVTFVRKKSAAFKALIDHVTFIQNQHDDVKIKTIRSDRGGEYMSDDAKAFLTKRGIHHECTIHHSPEQNGVAERAN
jgi:hypothetical protein